MAETANAMVSLLQLAQIRMENGKYAVDMSGLSAGGSIGQTFLVRGTYANVTGTIIVANPGGNFRNHLRYVGYLPAGYTNSGLSTTTDYAPGTCIVVNTGSGATPSIGTLVTPYLRSADTTEFITSDSGYTVTSALSGTWRCRGKISSTLFLMQRVDP